MLNQNTIRVEWDDSNIREIEDAKDLYRQARAEGRVVTTEDGTIVESFRTFYRCLLIKEAELSEDQFAVRFHDETGDRRLAWDARSVEEVMEASKLFHEYLEKGWKAYAVDKDGKQGKRIYGFDPTSMEVFFDDKTAQEKMKKFKEKLAADLKEVVRTAEEKAGAMKKFVKEMKRVLVVPKTHPG